MISVASLWRLAPRFAVLGSALVVSAELTSRVDDYVRLGVPLAHAPDLRNDLILTDSLGTRGVPNGRFQHWQLNSAGFRSPESVLTPVPGCTRVMALGASETFGAASESPGKEFVAQLSDSLNRVGCFQVLNAAVVGLTTPQIIQLWNLWASRFRPDIVVALANPQFYLIDRAPAFPTLTTGHGQPPNRWWIPRLISRAQEAFEYPRFIQRIRVQRQLKRLTEGHPPEWLFRTIPEERLSQYRRDLDSLVTTIRSHGAVPVLVTYPIRFGTTLVPEDHDMMEDWRQYAPRATPEVLHQFALAAAEEVRRLAQARSIALVELAGPMNGHREWFGDVVHYSDRGAAEVARRVAQVVAAAARRAAAPHAAP